MKKIKLLHNNQCQMSDHTMVKIKQSKEYKSNIMKSFIIMKKRILIKILK